MTLGLPDGAITGDGSGHYCRIFRPRWWQLGRWLHWFMLPAEKRIEFSTIVTVPVAGAQHGVMRVRAELVDRPRHVGRGVWG